MPVQTSPPEYGSDVALDLLRAFGIEYVALNPGVLEGEGYSTVNGERVDWEAGDLILLPLLPEEVEHQHFNRNPGRPCRWLAFIHMGVFEAVATELTQTELSPEYQAR